MLKLGAGRRRIWNAARGLSTHRQTAAQRLDRLTSENTELRAKVIDLILEIQTLREGERDGRRIGLTRSRNRGSSSKVRLDDDLVP
jgi:hypothetical protein